MMLTACSTLSYYSQAISGHLKLMRAREDVNALLESPETDQALREKLRLATEIRAFASQELGLPNNDSYTTYVATGRRYVTWNVVAAEEFSVQAKTWCFPVAGCVSYKGYFDESEARAEADALAQAGYDTTVTGATAYSTLGWFDDPLLDIMLRGREVRLAGVIFHELAHQQLYVKDDSDFNEAYASFVEQEGVRHWLKNSGREDLLPRYADMLQRRHEFSEMLLRTRKRLQTLYASSADDVTKREGKVQAFENLRADYAQFKARWNQYRGYDGWFGREINNARLVASATYRRLVPAFAAVYDQVGREFEAFYREAERLAALDKPERQAALSAALAQSSAPDHHAQ